MLIKRHDPTFYNCCYSESESNEAFFREIKEKSAAKFHFVRCCMPTLLYSVVNQIPQVCSAVQCGCTNVFVLYVRKSVT